MAKFVKVQIVVEPPTHIGVAKINKCAMYLTKH